MPQHSEKSCELEHVGWYERLLYKGVPLWLVFLCAIVAIIFMVLFSAIVRHTSIGGRKYGWVGEMAVSVSSFPSLVKEVLIQGTSKPPLLLDVSFKDVDGFKVNGAIPQGLVQDNGYLLLSMYDPARQQSITRLIRLSDQKILNEWVPDLKALESHHRSVNDKFKVKGVKSDRFRMGNPLLVANGGLIFHGFPGPLFKLDVCSRIEWVNDDNFHHAINPVEDGFWVSSIVQPTKYVFGDADPYKDDAIAKVGYDGKLIFERSVTDIFVKNGYRGLIFGAGRYEFDPVHLNDVVPAKTTTKYWQKGDLLLSLRSRSTVALYRPSEDRLIWVKTGPWLNQHSPSFLGDSKIALYGNDVIRVSDEKTIFPDVSSNYYVFEFRDGSISKPLDAFFKKKNIKSGHESRQHSYEDGSVFIEDLMSGRLFKIKNGVLQWMYATRVDDRTVGMLNWSRYITEREATAFHNIDALRCTKK